MKRASRLIILLLIVSLLFSVAFVAIESGHDCHGKDDCPICKIIALLSATIWILFLSFFLFFGFCRAEYSEWVDADRGDRVTLVDLKVKLSN